MTTAYTKTATLLKIDHVSVSFGDKVVLDDVCAEVKDIERPDCVQGQVVCFLGPSGIGKSTLSRVIAGLLTPTSGEVLVNYATADVPILAAAHKGAVGMVPQTYPLFEFATVWDNILIASAQRQPITDAVKTGAAMLLEEFGLTPYLHYYPNALSGGTRQRVAIVRQLVCAGRYLVLDEPFSGLDLVMKQKACALITKVANLDTLNTVIIITHDVTEGMSVADQVWLMARPKPPTYNHTRGDSALTPCPECAAWGRGARIVNQYDLAAMDLCWRPDLILEPRFQAVVAEVKARFQEVV